MVAPMNHPDKFAVHYRLDKIVLFELIVQLLLWRYNVFFFFFC